MSIQVEGLIGVGTVLFSPLFPGHVRALRYLLSVRTFSAFLFANWNGF